MDVDSVSVVVEENYVSVKEELVAFIQTLFDTKGKIPLHAPFISETEKEALSVEFNTNLFSSASPTVALFEKKIAAYLGVPYVLATNSGTSALHAALLASGVQAGDIVITQAVSFVATANVISYCGAAPVFLDVSADGLSLCPQSLRRFLETECVLRHGKCVHENSGRVVKACIPVHTFGNPAEIEVISKLLQSYFIDLIEDAAQAFGSEYKHRKCGTFGRFGCFSFNGNKIISTGGGGAIVCQNEEDYEMLKKLINQGKEAKGFHYYHSMIGFNYKMTGLGAAIGIQQLERIEEILLHKKNLNTEYKQFFNNKGIQTLADQNNACSNHWLTNILVANSTERDELIAYLNNNSIEARPLWWPLHELPIFEKKHAVSCSVSNTIHQCLVSLPSGQLYTF